LQALALDATQRKWPGLALEARLAALHVQSPQSDSATLESSRKALQADAHRAGYGWVERRLR
jgi:hypothetical protein